MLDEPTARDMTLKPHEREILRRQAIDAQAMHQLWVDRGMAFIVGRPIDVPPEFASREDLCPVGVWLRDRLDARLKASQLFERTNASHDEFHVALSRLFKESPQRISPDVRAEFQRLGLELTQLIDEWIALGGGSTRGET